ncbi:hypothetical protein FB451DRAFT_1256193 [Mycena latifolia]|nr:hypothetical protein FB451DRAFT_1256193 [Mycena latifolia]
MPVLPQELLDAIVGDVDDVTTLKSCSLVGTMLCKTSQCILLRSLTVLSTGGKNYTKARGLLEDSPHIAGYITRLKIQIPRRDDDIESLQQVLHKLVNVRRCILDGVLDDFVWDDITPPFASSLLNFIERQPLHELHLDGIEELPMAVFLRLVAAAPILSFYFVSVKADEDLLPISPHPLAIEHLILATRSEDICTIFACPDSRLDVMSLRRLSIMAHYTHAEAFIRGASLTLQSLRLYCDVPGKPLALSLPSLPILHSLELVLDFADHAAPWFIETLVRVLTPTTSPVLAEITVTFSPILLGFGVRSYLLGPELMAPLDNALAAHSASPRMHWRVRFPTAKGAHHFADFVRATERGMPKVHGVGCLTFEAYRVRFEAYVDGLPEEVEAAT